MREPPGSLLRQLLSKSWRFLILPVALAFAVGFASLCMPTVWTSRCQLDFPPLPSDVEFVAAMEQATAGGATAGLAAQLAGTGSTLDRCMAVLRSERIRGSVVDHPDLQQALPAILQTTSRNGLIDAVGQGAVFSSQPGNILTIQASLPGPSKLAMLFLKRSPKPSQQAVAALVDAYGTELRGYMNDVSASHDRAEVQYIGPQVWDSYRRLLRLQAQQAALTEHGVPLSPTEERPMLSQRLGKVEDARADAAVDLAAAQRAKLASRARLSQMSQTIPSQWQKARNPEVDRLQSALADARTRYYVLQTTDGKSDKHPDVRRELANIEQLERELKAALGRSMPVVSEAITRNPNYDALVSGHLQAEIAEASAQSKVAALASMRNEIFAKLRGLQARQVQQLRLEGDYQVEVAIYATLRKALAQAKIREQRSAEVFVVLDAARPPLKKSGPSTVKNALLGFLLGILLITALTEAPKLLAALVSANAAGAGAGPEGGWPVTPEGGRSGAASEAVLPPNGPQEP